MLAEKTNTAQAVIDRISPNAAKVNYISDEALMNALQYIEQKGFPGNKHEDYKYCNMDAVLKKEFKNIEQKFNTLTTIESYKIPGTITLVVLNGIFSKELSDQSLPEGLNVKPLSQTNGSEKTVISSLAKVTNDAFIALNTAFSSDGFFLEVQKNVVIETPINILYISTSEGEAFVNTRNFIMIHEHAQASVIEQQLLASGKVFTNFLSEKLIHQNAHLRTYTIQNESEKGFSVNTQQVKLMAGSVYENTTITLSGQVVRNNHNVEIAGEGSTAHLYGIFSARGQQLVDNHTLMDHQVPNCESNELYKGIASQKSTGVFNGKIFVRKDAQKTNAYQSSKNILLSDDATINTKPQLEIYANDVKCSHGTSTGKIDENALFYLNARGIGKETGRKMLLASFAQEVINKIEFEPLREKMNRAFENMI